tara:strand:- start:57 stop:719 length:663 start_codon:yes stop_codon:yes gene_type:complete
MAANKRYTDPISGIDYRWDDTKNKWVKSTGRDPWSDDLQPFLDSRIKTTKDYFSNITQNISDNLENNKELTDQQRGVLAVGKNLFQNLGILADDPDTPTSNYVAATMSEGGNKNMLEGTINAAKNVNSTDLEEDIAVKEEPIEKKEVKTKKSKGPLVDSDEFTGDNAPGMKDAKTIFLEDTAKSPAAKAGLDDDLRWQARQRYEDFLKKRKVETSLGKAK